jgi:hypothetical protein
MMKTSSLLRFLSLFGLLLLAGLSFWTCDVSDSGSHQLTINLSDSSHTCDSILVTLKTPDGKIYLSKTFRQKEFGPLKNGKFQVTLDLGANPPTTYDVIITNFKGDKASKYKVVVTPEEIKKPEILSDTTNPDTTKLKPIGVEVINKSPQILAAQGAVLRLEAHVLPAKANQGLTWETSNGEAASVDTDGTVHPGAVGEADITVRSKADPTLSAKIHVKIIVPPKVDSIGVTPDTALMYLGGETLKLTPHIVVEGNAASAVTFESSDKAIATLADSVVTVHDTGRATVTVRPLGDTLLSATCKIHVVKDVPDLEAGGDRVCKKGDTLTFHIQVTQKYGGIAALRWDLDGDSAWDDSVKDSSASPSHVYNGKDTLVTVSFYVQDSEGNKVTVTHKVHVSEIEDLRPKFSLPLNPSAGVAEGATLQIDFAAADPEGGATTLARVLDSSYGGSFNATTGRFTWTPGYTSAAGSPYILTVRATSGGQQSDTAVVITVTPGTLPTLPAPVISAAPQAQTTDATPTWAWSSSGNANVKTPNSYRYRLLNSSFANWTVTSSTTWTPNASLTDGSFTFELQQKDVKDNWSDTAESQVRVDSHPPALALAGGLTLNGSSTIPATAISFTGTANDGQGMGVQKVTYQLSSGGAEITATGTTSWSTPSISLSDGTTTRFTFRAYDNIGNPASSGIYDVTVVTPPTATFDESVTPHDAFVTNHTSVNYKWKENGVDKSGTFQLTSFGANTLTLTATKAPNTPVSISRTFYRVAANVRFVTQAGGGNLDGSSWDDAWSDVQHALDNVPTTGEIWVAKGIYTPGTTDIDLYRLIRSVKIYGGFKGSEFDRNNRLAKGQTVFDGVDNRRHIMEIGFSNTMSGPPLLDGLKFSHAAEYAVVLDSGAITFNDCEFSDNTVRTGIQGPAAIEIFSAQPSFNNCRFINNSGHSGGAVRINNDLQTASIDFVNCQFKGNSNSQGADIYFYSFDFGNSVDVYFEGGCYSQDGIGPPDIFVAPVKFHFSGTVTVPCP